MHDQNTEGEYITIAGTTSYNDVYQVTKPPQTLGKSQKPGPGMTVQAPGIDLYT